MSNISNVCLDFSSYHCSIYALQVDVIISWVRYQCLISSMQVCLVIFCQTKRSSLSEQIPQIRSTMNNLYPRSSTVVAIMKKLTEEIQKAKQRVAQLLHQVTTSSNHRKGSNTLKYIKKKTSIVVLAQHARISCTLKRRATSSIFVHKLKLLQLQ